MGCFTKVQIEAGLRRDFPLLERVEVGEFLPAEITIRVQINTGERYCLAEHKKIMAARWYYALAQWAADHLMAGLGVMFVLYDGGQVEPARGDS